MKEYYRRHLPHYHPQHATYFITFRLIHSLSHDIIGQLKDEFHAEKEMRRVQIPHTEKEKNSDTYYRTYFEAFDNFLDLQREFNCWLNDESIAQIVSNAIHYRDKKEYDLICFTIMPNHVHMVIALNEYDIASKDLSGRKVRSKYTLLTMKLHSLKRYTAFECNKALHRSGAFWQSESYDHVVRTEIELERTIRYVMNNPVKAGLVTNVKDWKYSYCKYTL